MFGAWCQGCQTKAGDLVLFVTFAYQSCGTWNVTFPMGKEPELLCKIERYQLDIVTSMHGVGFVINFLKRGLTLFHTGITHGDRCRASVGLHIASLLGTCV